MDSFRRMIDSFEYLKLVLGDTKSFSQQQQQHHEIDFAQSKVKNFCSLLRESHQSEEARLNDMHTTVVDKLTKYIDNDAKLMKETRKQFERVSNELDACYQKNADLSKTSKQSQYDETERQLNIAKKSFDQHVIMI